MDRQGVLELRRRRAAGCVDRIEGETPADRRVKRQPLSKLVVGAVHRRAKKVRPAFGGRPAAREPGLGTGRGGDVTELA